MMKKIFEKMKTLLVVAILMLIGGSALAMTRRPDSSFRAGWSQVYGPNMAVRSGGEVTGGVLSGGEGVMVFNETGENKSYLPLVNASGYEYIHTGDLAGYETDPVYLSESGDIVRYTEGQGRYVPSNGGTFADATRWATSPSDAEILEKYFGTNSAYVDLWSSNPCDTGSMSVTYVAGGNVSATDFNVENTIFVLTGDSYTSDAQELLSSSCSALVGNGIVFTGGGRERYIEGSYSTSVGSVSGVIIDGIVFSGTNSNALQTIVISQGRDYQRPKEIHNITIQGNTFIGTDRLGAIELDIDGTYAFSGVYIINNTFNATGNVIQESHGFVPIEVGLYNNTFTGGGDGISLNNTGSEFDIRYNTFTGMVLALEGSWSTTQTVDYNIFCNNTSDGYTGTNALACGAIIPGGTVTYTKYDSTIQFNSLVDAAGNAYITGYTESDPIRTAEKSDYATTGSVSAITLSSGNGITIDGSNNIDLGGTMDQTTYLDTYGHDFVVREGSGLPETLFAGDNFKIIDGTTEIYFGIGSPTSVGITWDLPSSAHSLFWRDDSIYVTSDTGVFQGLEYAGDYSANYTSRSLPDVEYMTGYVDTAVTASNGLTEVGTDVQMGGTLTKKTNIDLNSQTLNIRDAGGTQRYMDRSSNYLQAPGSTTWMDMQDAYLDLRVGNGGGDDTKIKMRNDSITVEGQAGVFSGMEYFADYSAQYKPRSIPDVAYVTGGINDMSILNRLTIGGSLPTPPRRLEVAGYMFAGVGDNYISNTTGTLNLVSEDIVNIGDAEGVNNETYLGVSSSTSRFYFNNGDQVFPSTGNYVYFGVPNSAGSARIGMSGFDLCIRLYSGGASDYVVSSCDTL